MNNRQRYQQSPLSVVDCPAGTEQGWNALEEVTTLAKRKCGEWVEFFRSQGAKTPTEIGQAAQRFARDTAGKLAGVPAVSNTSLHKRADLSPAHQKTVAALWSIETRARQLFDKTGTPIVKGAAPSAAAPSAAAPSAAAPSAAPSADTKKTAKLPNTTGNTLPVERVALAMLIDLLDRGIASESWQEIADARKMLSGFLA